MKSKAFWNWFDHYAAPRLDAQERAGDRASTFRKMFQHLDAVKGPVCIVETGVFDGVNEEKEWAFAGCSTISFDKYVEFNGGHFYSVDILEDKVNKARQWAGSNTTITASDSIAYLKEFPHQPDLVYLDGSHLYWHCQLPSQVHHYNELMAIMPKLRPETLVAVDDSPTTIDDQVQFYVDGKGALVARYADDVGAEMAFIGYQCGWQGFPGLVVNADWDTHELIKKGRECVEAGRWHQAYKFYRAVLMRTAPPWTGVQRVMRGEACAYLARLAMQFGKFGTAYDWYNSALEADPRCVDYRIELANKVLRPMGMKEGALTHAERAVKVAPTDQYAWRTLGLVEGEQGNLEKSVAAHSKQIELSNRASVSLLDKVTMLIDLEEYTEAEQLCDEVIVRNDNMLGDAVHCKALIAARHDDHEGAIKLYKRAIDIGCCDPSLAHFHLALSLFSIGRYAEGFPHQSKRIDNKTDPALYVPMRRFKKPLFAMQPAPAVIHIHAESGAGDIMAQWRYFPLLQQRGYTLHYETRPELVQLAQDSLTDVKIMETAVDYPGALGIGQFDYHLPIGEFPSLFGTDIDTVPWNGPYIKSNAKLARGYRDAPKIGIAWGTGIRGAGWLKRYGEYKSLSFNLIRPIIEANPAAFASLQAGPPRYENDLIADLLPDNPTWADTAALIENLDLVITPDTGLAHLAGAMGKPTWIMMHAYNMGWHFMCERPGAPWNERSPWYPSVRLFRQRRATGWQPVIERIVLELRNGKARQAA